QDGREKTHPAHNCHGQAQPGAHGGEEAWRLILLVDLGFGRGSLGWFVAVRAADFLAGEALCNLDGSVAGGTGSGKGWALLPTPPLRTVLAPVQRTRLKQTAYFTIPCGSCGGVSSMPPFPAGDSTGARERDCRVRPTPHQPWR